MRGAGAVLATDIGQLVEGQLAENEEEQLGVILLEGQVLLECVAHLLHHAELLGLDEALQHHADGHAYVRLQDVFAQMDAGMRLGHTDHTLNVSHRNGQRACGEGLLAQLGIHLGDLVLVDVLEGKIKVRSLRFPFFKDNLTVSLGRMFSLA